MGDGTISSMQLGSKIFRSTCNNGCNLSGGALCSEGERFAVKVSQACQFRVQSATCKIVLDCTDKMRPAHLNLSSHCERQEKLKEENSIVSWPIN